MAKQAYVYDGTTWVPVGSQAVSATSANTVNQIVQRDGSGNFSAGTVSLSGSLTVGGLTIKASVGGIGSSTATNANTTITHGLGTTPSSAVACVRADTYAAARSIFIYTGNIGATTFTVGTSTGSAGVSAAYAWVAVA